jgi:hypothetical protein
VCGETFPYNGVVWRLQLSDGAVLAEHSEAETHIDGGGFARGEGLALGPDNTLFVTFSSMDYGHGSKVVAFNATTLAVQFQFGHAQLADSLAGGVAIVNGEIYVCATTFPTDGRLAVFSLSGTHLRVIEGEWRWPLKVCGLTDRL